MIVTTVSDIHCQFDKFKPQDLIDLNYLQDQSTGTRRVLVVAGDLTNFGINDAQELAKSRAWMFVCSQKFDAVVWIPGNHDFGATPDLYSVNRNVFWVLDSAVNLFGVRFRGASLSPCFDIPRLADYWCLMTADREREKAYFNAIPDDHDILVSHCPPMGMCDLPGRPIGSPTLLKRMEHLDGLKHVVCGHVHEGVGESEFVSTRGNKVRVINCAGSINHINIAV